MVVFRFRVEVWCGRHRNIKWAQWAELVGSVIVVVSVIVIVIMAPGRKVRWNGRAD